MFLLFSCCISSGFWWYDDVGCPADVGTRVALQRCRGKQRFWAVCIGWKMRCGRARTTATPSIPHYPCVSSNDMSSKLANTLGTSSFATDCVASLWPLGNVRKIVRHKESIWTWKFHALEGCILFTVPHQVLDINRNAIKLRSLKFRTCKSSCTLDLPGICSFQGSFPMQDLAATWSKDCTFDFKKNKLPKHFPASKANRANECSTDVHKLSPQQKEWKREEKERRRICYDLRAVARTVHLKKVKIWAGWGHIHLKSNKISWFCKCAWQKV